MVTWEENFKRVVLDDPEFLDKLCGYVAGGGSVLDLCDKEKVLYDHVAVWLYKNKENEARYDRALKARDEWTKEVVLREMRTIALSDIRQCFDEHGNLRDVHLWPANVAKAVASIEIDELFEGRGRDKEHVGYTKKIKFWDKGKQLEALAKKLGFFVEKHEHTLGKTLEDLIVGSFSDAKKD